MNEFELKREKPISARYYILQYINICRARSQKVSHSKKIPFIGYCSGCIIYSDIVKYPIYLLPYPIPIVALLSSIIGCKSGDFYSKMYQFSTLFCCILSYFKIVFQQRFTPYSRYISTIHAYFCVDNIYKHTVHTFHTNRGEEVVMQGNG